MFWAATLQYMFVAAFKVYGATRFINNVCILSKRRADKKNHLKWICPSRTGILMWLLSFVGKSIKKLLQVDPCSSLLGHSTLLLCQPYLRNLTTLRTEIADMRLVSRCFSREQNYQWLRAIVNIMKSSWWRVVLVVTQGKLHKSKVLIKSQGFYFWSRL